METVEPVGGRGSHDQESLAGQVRLLHAMIDRLPAMIAYWDRDLRNVVANNAYIEWFGFSPEEMRGIHIREVLGERVFAMNLPYIQGALAGEEQLFDRTLVDTFGRTRHTQASYVPDLVDGEVRGFFVLVTDVTPRVDAQRAMDEAQSLAGVGSWEQVLGTGELSFSDELFRIFGEEPGAFVPTAEAMLQRIHPDDVARVVEARAHAVDEGTSYSLEYRIVRPDGSVREIRSHGRAAADSSGTIVRLSGTLQDVTEANQAARELARTNAELVQMNELNADVVGMLGHDVRGPLTVVLGYLEELDEDWATTTETLRRQHVATARAAAVRLKGLVDDILALASLESGEIAAEASDHDLALLVAEGLSGVPGQADIALEGDRDLRVWCDAFHVRQIIANLAGNALRHGAPPIAIRLEGGDATAAVAVTDHGPGVPEDFVPRLFDRFARGPVQQVSGSSGLGLYIATRLAAANDGTLTYAPGPDGRGACFTLTLPRFG